MGKILGIDHGTKRIGIALSDETHTIAFGKDIIESGSAAFKKIAELVKLNDVTSVIIGYPVNLKGLKTKQTEEVDKFIELLSKSLSADIKVEKWDERLTSVMAQSYIIDSGMKKKKRQDKSNLDTLSAMFILQSYLDNKKNTAV
jgi:putative Holliday junction resolvase